MAAGSCQIHHAHRSVLKGRWEPIHLMERARGDPRLVKLVSRAVAVAIAATGTATVAAVGIATVAAVGIATVAAVVVIAAVEAIAVVAAGQAIRLGAF